ncbi:MAG: 6,7-dimethyl-8-ribityllumazine synthase [Hyphomicrobium sp.]|nr:6,7-dimethyl-8-ribityllumazine synthase [Hyphomicrobium sp.]PPC80231.1 MAG: 6,7-dimethyl-8-ribityllumazine synthase [Hyphomicrobium sp.]
MISRVGIPSSKLSKPPETPRIKARVLIIEARYYEKVSDELVAGATAELDACGVTYQRVVVPGALEIPHVLALSTEAGLIPRGAPSALFCGAIALGCVIRGETSHYDVVVDNANHWLMEVAVRHHIPIGNGILTVDTEAQAMARARGGREGKGGDAARACLRLIELQRTFQGQGA